MEKISVFDKQEKNTFEIYPIHFLRMWKAYPDRFEPKDEVGIALIKEVNIDDIDIGTTKEDEKQWEDKLKKAKERERVDQLEKVVAEKLALLYGKKSTVKEEFKKPDLQEDKEIEIPVAPNWNKKELDQMDMSQLVAIYQEIFPNKSLPKSKKQIIAEILQ